MQTLERVWKNLKVYLNPSRRPSPGYKSTFKFGQTLLSVCIRLYQLEKGPLENPSTAITADIIIPLFSAKHLSILFLN